MNRLKLMAEFSSALADYKPSKTAQDTLNNIKLVLFHAPSGGGRNTIMYKLLESGNYYFIVSDTTRQPRINDGRLEKSGREYWFRTEEEVLGEIKRGEFLEAEIIHGQQVSGTSIRELEKARQLHKIAIDEVDIGGVANILKAKPDTLVVMVLPPSFKEWMRRFELRGHLDPDERRRRLETAVRIYEKAASGMFPIVINDNLEDAVKRVDRLVRLEEKDPEQQKKDELLARQLYIETRAHLDMEV